MGYDVLVAPGINDCGCRAADRCVEAYPLPLGTLWCTASFCGNISVIQSSVAIGSVAYVLRALCHSWLNLRWPRACVCVCVCVRARVCSCCDSSDIRGSVLTALCPPTGSVLPSVAPE
jgi:hypothetical protein